MIQFLAQTAPREVTHFVLLSRGNTERMLDDQPLKITPQKEATGMVILAYESYAEGILDLADKGVVPLQQRDVLLKQVEEGRLDKNLPPAGPGDVVEMNVVRVRRIQESCSIAVRVEDLGDGTIRVNGGEPSHEKTSTVEETALEVAEEGMYWRQNSAETLDSHLTGPSQAEIKKFFNQDSHE